jgi:hypothetical protein
MRSINPWHSHFADVNFRSPQSVQVKLIASAIFNLWLAILRQLRSNLFETKS